MNSTNWCKMVINNQNTIWYLCFGQLCQNQSKISNAPPSVVCSTWYMYITLHIIRVEIWYPHSSHTYCLLKYMNGLCKAVCLMAQSAQYSKSTRFIWVFILLGIYNFASLLKFDTCTVHIVRTYLNGLCNADSLW